MRSCPPRRAKEHGLSSTADVRRRLARIALAGCVALVAAQAVAGDLVPRAVALTAAMLAPVALFALFAPPGRSGAVAVLALGAALLAPVVATESLHRGIVSGGRPESVARGLAWLLLVAAIAPAVVLAWAFARAVPGGRVETREGSQ
jgi:hypothetical protein